VRHFFHSEPVRTQAGARGRRCPRAASRPPERLRLANPPRCATLRSSLALGDITINLLSQLVGHLQEVEELSREETRSVWQGWSLSFCGNIRGKWDAIGRGNQRYGRQAIRSYTSSSSGRLYFGAPDRNRFFSAACRVLPPYEFWLELYESFFNDALYIWSADGGWTLAIHHEQFGGQVKGPIWAETI